MKLIINCILGNQKPSSETRTLDVHVDDSELIACLEEVEGKAGKGEDYMSITCLTLSENLLKKWEAIYFVCQHLKSNLNFSNNSVLKYRVCYVCYNSFDIKIYLRITESSYILVFISKYMRVICLLYIIKWACCTVWLWRVNIEWLYVVSVSFYICFALVKSIIITV